ncbi:MAG: hypothetical protein M0D57_11200 [Sphingobacteriales bacterium JAD_PAG50586_3]|nr:MAG: hypothetical protein M0D57_11200 [Sphingobacteriales bacterium JAD_PAG50586_3]
MRTVKIILSAILLLVMALLTAWCYHPLAKLMLISISAEYMVHTAVPLVVFPTLFVLLFGALLVYYFKQPTKLKLAALFVVFSVWLLSGRTTAMLVTEDEIAAGWFYIPTTRFTLCNPNENCEITHYNKTKVEVLPFWRIRISNSTVDETLFIGPFAWAETKKLFIEDMQIGLYYKE